MYLDLNHWISLTRASLGKQSDDYRELLHALRQVRAENKVRIVLTSSFVEEFSSISDPRQRDDIVALIDELTDFDYLLGLPDVFRLELQAFLDAKFGEGGLRWSATPLLGASMLHSLGRVGGLKIIDQRTGEDVTDAARSRPVRGDGQWFEKLQRRAERELLAGPRDAELDQLRESGYQPERAREGHRNNVLIEQYLADAQLTSRWRKGRLLDVLAARHVSLELIDALQIEMNARQITLDDIARATDQVVELPLSMPSSCVFVGLKAQYHRDATRKWTTNDLHDIAAMSLAIPYCDIVFTDAAVRNAALTAGLDRTMSTQLPRKPRELVGLLRNMGMNGQS